MMQATAHIAKLACGKRKPKPNIGKGCCGKNTNGMNRDWKNRREREALGNQRFLFFLLSGFKRENAYLYRKGKHETKKQNGQNYANAREAGGRSTRGAGAYDNSELAEKRKNCSFLFFQKNKNTREK